MFYSQFILAKKGPLGTIWIAAHLERKLRKNQVADTDIGVSVDSILFPEVPIALRLSSHLLLGVVRIYSRKVNYLFHDCSEALLKIKQAFRSTAVDLPPEESTAPYHSITLPETFDLDDFELPDFGFSHGNYVDHHVSTREQITLQDTMDDMVFSTSQFGLDERFGDEGASQLGLDFDEGFLLDTVHSPAHTSALLSSDDNVLEQVNDQTKASIGSMEFDEQPYDVNATRNSGCAEHTEEFPSLGCSKQVDFSSLNSEGNGSVDLVGIEIRTPELIKESLLHMVDQEQLLDPQGAPSTPGLTEKAITRNVDELPSLCNLRKDSYSPDSFLDEPDNSKLAAGESDEGIKNIIAGKSIETVMPVAVLDGSSNDVNSNDVMDIDHGSHDIQMMPPNDDVACEQHDHGMLHDMTVISKSSDPKVAKVSEVTCQEILADSTAVNNVECKDCSAPDHLTAEASAEADNSTCSSNCVLHACNKIPETVNNMNLQDESSKEQASCCSNEVAGTEHDTLGNEKQLHGMTVDGSTQQLVSSQPSEKVILSNTDERCLNISQPDVGHIQESDYPDLETLCSAPPEASDLPEDLVAKDSSSHDASLLSDKRAMTVSGKKRTSMDSSPVLPDGNPSKTSKFSQTSRSVNFIPNDDDLLASILVGRRTPIFKIKSTPTDEALPSRRPRASNKGSAQKRKVLLDDTMVLHGDIIRQQLTSIEDIRKLRRKAPCTTLEIWRIQKLASADEIFIEPLFSGVCPAITCLYSKTLSLTGDGNFSLISKDVEPVGSSDVVKEPNSKNVVELLRNSPRSNCLQVQESAEKLESKMSLLHSLESMKDADETLVHEPRVCIASEAPLEDDRNGYSVTNDISSDHPVENDTLLISPLTEHVQNNGSTDFVITVDGTGGINPSHSDMGSTLGKDAPNEASFPLMEATENKHVDIVKEVTEEHYALGEKSDKLVIGGVDGMPSSSVKLDFQPQWLDNGEISCPVLPDATQFGHSLSRGNESLNSEMYDGSSHERNMPVNKVHDECASGDDKVMTEMVSRDSKISTMLVDIDNAVSCPALLQYEAQHFPMCIEGASDHGNQIAVEGDSGKALNQFEELGCGDEGNGIEFLNADDEPELEEDGGMNTSTVEHEKIEDNSGWSIRTRGVAKYLKSLFESIESDSNKLEIATQKSVPLDRLLAGKTRKEASRMFFETLVLNTRDYINVKQELPFDSVGVGPKPKLMKSDF